MAQRNAENQSRRPSGSLKFRSFFVTQFDRASQFVDDHSWMLIPLFAALYTLTLHRWHYKRLWYDELFTYYIAQAPSFAEMLKWTHTIDLNPPLYYIAARLTFHFLHPSSFSVRLPSIIAYFVAVVCVFLFVRRRLSPLYGAVAALVLLGSSYSSYSLEARPYAFVLCFLGVSAVGWQLATEAKGRKRFLPLTMVVIGGLGLLLSHVLALAAYGALIFGEFVRVIRRQTVDWPLLICLLAPLFVCVGYLPLIRQHSAGVYPPVFQASVLAAFSDYAAMWIEVAPLLAAALVFVALLGNGSTREMREASDAHFTVPELAFLTCLLLVPLAVIVEFMRSHSQFFTRYGISAEFAVAALVAALLSWWSRNSRRAASIGVVVFLFAVVRPVSLARILQHILEPDNTAVPVAVNSNESLSQIEPGLPFVAADGLTFVEMNYLESPQFLSRVYYLVDPKAAYEYAHANGFNGMAALKGRFPIDGNIEPYESFVPRHRKFLVLGSYDTPDDWILKKLLADNATLRFLGEFKTDYKDHDLYEVTLAPSATAHKP